ncbi:hypothetical protein CDCA_CDCA10G3023 [Cyanidium caldarium]|uniref:Uncharacterized protein n=1 Tax=Cyanidium caldarium TaxID=2771 RepID=A0AAV9IXF9_CYACA|nr:hypothetical protein CDCA_CDCA10G3023 [Cyanidium caldarium]
MTQEAGGDRRRTSSSSSRRRLRKLRIPRQRTVSAPASAAFSRERFEQWAQQRTPNVSLSEIIYLEAVTVPEVMYCFWDAVLQRQSDAHPEAILAFPHFRNGSTLSARIAGHVHECADVCTVLGQQAYATFFGGSGAEDSAPCFCVHLRMRDDVADNIGSVDGGADAAVEEEEEDEDEWLSPHLAALLEQARRDDEAELQSKQGTSTDSAFDHSQSVSPSVPRDTDQILHDTKRWVESVVAGAHICPFMLSAECGGLPSAPVHYEVSGARSPEHAYRDFWAHVALLQYSDPKRISTTLLVTPHLLQDGSADDSLCSAEAFDAVTAPLQSALTELGLEQLVQLVFFHPGYVFRDGNDRYAVDAQVGARPTDYARRSPWPMINVLRTRQVRMGQRGIPTESVYRRNAEFLAHVGVRKLQRMLEERDWSGMSGDAQADAQDAASQPDDVQQAVERVRRTVGESCRAGDRP